MTETYCYVLNQIDQLVEAHRAVLRLAANNWYSLATITLGPVPLRKFDSGDPLNILTRRIVDEGMSVVVAAGNEGRLVEGNSLNPWSVAPWVIGVGATTADGLHLLDTSSRGVANQGYEAPSVVAPGEAVSEVDTIHEDDAAIHNIRMSPPNSATIATTGKHVYKFQKDDDGKIWVSVVEKGSVGPRIPLDSVAGEFRKEHGTRARRIEGTSFAAEYVSGAVCNRIWKRTRSHMHALPVKERPKLVKTLLEDMAIPLQDYQSWEMGKGLVTAEIADRYLQELSESQFSRLTENALRRW